MSTATLNPTTCYRAFASRDRRFDGAFFMAVRTTGVYCRPGCPARLPARQNVRFFPSAAAAESAGFRACFRCRPDASPGSPAWSGTTATVARALRLIEESALEGVRVERVAERLGVSSRWMRRLFEEQLGAAPRDVARTQRAHFARRLIEQSRMPLADVALASGFGGERRLRAAIHTAFHRSPAELRGSRAGRATTGSSETASAGVIELRLPARPPFDARPMMSFFAPRAIDGVERVTGGVYARSFRLDGVAGWFEVRALPDDSALSLRVACGSPRALLPVAGRVSRMFDLGADVRGIMNVLRRDPLLASRIPRSGVRVPGAWDPFEAGVRAILGQQISVAAARTLAARLVRAYGEPLADVPADGVARGISADLPQGISHVFPTPTALADADLADARPDAGPRRRPARLRRRGRRRPRGTRCAARDRGFDRVADRAPGNRRVDRPVPGHASTRRAGRFSCVGPGRAQGAGAREAAAHRHSGTRACRAMATVARLRGHRALEFMT